MARVLLFIFSVASNIVFSQTTDDFNDGAFADGNPLTWVSSQTSGGDDFIVTNGEIQSAGTPSMNGDIYLSTNLGIDFTNNDAVWTFKARYAEGAPSGGNRIEIYFISDVADVTGTPVGYYIGMGESGTGDGIDFFKTNSRETLINDTNDLVGSGIDTHVRVTRTIAGLWTLEADASGGDTFTTIGTVIDTDFISGDFFGFYVKHSSTRFDDFFFDDFTIALTPSVDTAPPTIQAVTAISATQVDVRFNENMDAMTTGVVGNYSLGGEIEVMVAERDHTNNEVVHLTTSVLTNGEVYTITINNVEDENGNVIASHSQGSFEYLVTANAISGDVLINEFHASPDAISEIPNAEFIEIFNNSDKFIDLENWTFRDATGTSGVFNTIVLRPNEYLVVVASGKSSLFSSSGKVLEVPSFRSLNNSGDDIMLRNASTEIIHEISYSSSVAGISTELINPNDPCISELSYLESLDVSGGTPGRKNSVFDNTIDATPPTITSSNFNATLTIHFSETMDATSLSNGTYEASSLTVQQVLFEDFPTAVELQFTEMISAGVIYELTISGIEDCWGNKIQEATISFGLGKSPKFNELIITEIMFDPDPAQGLPEVEYIEIFNPTSNLLLTEGIQYSDATSTVSLPEITINPMSYYVLTTTSGAFEFSGINVIGVTSFPTLNNSGEPLILSRNDELIFSVTYHPVQHDPDKVEGGYSLEMKDSTNPCEEELNWGSSNHANGGTPGFENSITEAIPDNFGPEVIDAVAISPDTIRIDFNEKIDPQSVALAVAEFAPRLNVLAIDFDFNSPTSVFIVLAEDLDESKPHTLVLSGITDCQKNGIQNNETIFALPSQAVIGEVLLSEVLFNPRRNGVDFVEILNVSDKYLSLKNWQFARITSDGISDEEVISNEELVLHPGNYLAITEDKIVLVNNYPQGLSERFFEIASLPVYANDTGNVVLLNAENVLHELFHYEDDYHYDLLGSTDGVSLERISYDTKTNDPNSWRSAASTVGFATPGRANSQAFATSKPAGKVAITPKVFIPGNSGSGRDFTIINYQFDQPGKFANITIYDQTGRLVKNLAEGVLLATSGRIRWDGTSNAGKIARLGYHVVIFEVYDSLGHSEVIKTTVVVGRDF